MRIVEETNGFKRVGGMDRMNRMNRMRRIEKGARLMKR